MVKKIVYVQASTKKLYQLTGDWDRERDRPTMNSKARTRTDLGTWYGLKGTDLGSSFEHKGRIYFLFGDTHSINPSQPTAGDSIASTDDNNPEQELHLKFVTSTIDPNNYLAPRITNLPLTHSHDELYAPPSFEVPASGFSVNNKMYVFYTVDAFPDPSSPNPSKPDIRMGKSVLVRSDDDAQSPFRYLYDLSVIYQGPEKPLLDGKFVNVSTIIVDNTNIPGLPDRDGDVLLIWGSGLYRKSNPYLAYLPLTGIENKGNLRYFAGTEPGSNRPIWSKQESDAKELFNDQPEIGEICVNWNQFLGVWLMLYNAVNPRGINFRVAKKPWGPWSPTSVLFEPTIDGGYCHFIHGFTGPDLEVPCDSVNDDNNNDLGGEYGPYMITKYTKGHGRRSDIYFVMSTWNPYNTVLMRSTLELAYGQGKDFIQSSFGTKGNFELLVPQGDKLAHYFRDNDTPGLPWHKVSDLPNMPTISSGGNELFGAKAISGCLIQSNLGNPIDPNFEVVARMRSNIPTEQGDFLAAYFKPADQPWSKPFEISADGEQITGVTGNPVLIQSSFGTKGNFELLVPQGDKLAHYFRDNDTPGLPWHKKIDLTSLKQTDPQIIKYIPTEVSLIQSNFNEPGNLEVVSRMTPSIGNDLQDILVAYFMDSKSLKWDGPFIIKADGQMILSNRTESK